MSKKELPGQAPANARQQSAARFEAFDDSVMAAARRQAEAIVESARRQAQEEYDAQVAERRTDPVVLYRAEAAMRLARQAAAAKQENRRKLLVYRSQLVNALFAELEENLQAYTQTAAYLAAQKARMGRLAARLAEDGVQGRPCTGYVRRDERRDVRDAAAAAFPGCTVCEAPDIRLGGFRLQAGRLLYDATLDYCDGVQRQAFLSRCGLTVE